MWWSGPLTGRALEEGQGAGARGEGGVEERHEFRLDRVRRKRERREVFPRRRRRRRHWHFSASVRRDTAGFFPRGPPPML